MFRHPRIGFIGVGLMGSAMARNLLAAGFCVVVHDIDAAKVEALVAAGASKADAPDQIPPAVDVIVLSLPDSRAVADALNDSLRLPETGRKGLVVLDTSTIDLEVSSQWVAQLGSKGIAMLDAPVSGTPDMCARKENIFIVGGEREAFERCEPVFAAMSREWIHMGGSGSGLTAKLAVNLVLALNRMALAEGLTLARKAGLDQMKTLEVLKKSAAYSMAMDQKGERMVRRQFHPPIARLAITYKDVRFMLALGAKLDCPLPLTSLNAQALASEVCKGRAERDSSDIISFYDDIAK